MDDGGGGGEGDGQTGNHELKLSGRKRKLIGRRSTSCTPSSTTFTGTR